MSLTKIISLISQAGITGSDFTMWQKVLENVPKEALEEIEQLIREYPHSIDFFTNNFKKKIEAIDIDSKDLLDHAFEEEKNYIATLVS